MMKNRSKGSIVKCINAGIYVYLYKITRLHYNLTEES